MSKRKRGPSKLDVLALVFVLLLAAIFLLPKLEGVRMAHNETSALQALQFLHERMIELKDRRSGPAPDARLSPRELVMEPTGKSLLEDAHFESHEVVGSVMRRHGYYFAAHYLTDVEIGPRSGYVLFAWPVESEDDGRTSFAALPDGRLFHMNRRLSMRALSGTHRMASSPGQRPLPPGLPPGFEPLSWGD